MESYLRDTMYWVAFYINRTTIAIQGWMAALSNTLQPLLHTLSWVTNRYSQELSNAFVFECWQPVQRVADQLHHSLGQVIDSSWPILREFLQLETTIPMLTQAYHYITSQTQQALAIIQDDLYQFRESLPDAPHLRLISQLYQNVEDLLVHSLPLLRNLVENGVSGMVPHITSLVDRGMNLIEDIIDDMQAYSRDGILYSYMNELSVNLYDKVLLAWQRWKENDLALDSATAKSLMEIMKKVLSLDNDIFMESYVFEPETRGRVIYNQHLPMMWPSFLHTPHWHSLTGQSGVSEAQRILQEGVDMTSSSWATQWLPGSLLPPFTATASIIGQHITTFDLHHYEFLGPCSYLLTRDFVGGDFSVVGVYQAEAGVVGLASVEVHTPSGTFVLGVNGSVDTSQSQHEVHSAGGQTSLKVGSLLVSCDQTLQGCFITVSNKYFGRLAGLLGNYNHEPSDDSQGPDGQAVSCPAQLATRWAVGAEPCYQANQALQVEVKSADVKSVDECSALFLKGNSPFNRCFYSVSPLPYFTHCITDKDTSTGGKPGHDVCGAVTAYVTQCLTQGLSLPYPNKCKRGKEKGSPGPAAPVLSGSCEVPEGKPVPSQWSKTFQGDTQGSADIAFIIELANCNKGKNLRQFLQLLKVYTRKAGIEDVRYALLTVKEGNMGQPTPFMKEEDMVGHLNTLDLQGPKDDQGGAAAIISAAKSLKWRPGVSRTIVHLSCRPCDAGEVVHQALQENDITFHLVTKHKVTMAGPDAKRSEIMARKLLGFDSKFGYTVRDIKKFSGTEKLRVALQEPEGSCVVAAQASGGSVFNMNKWLPTKEVLARKFLRVLSQRVAVSTSAPECQKCQCVGGATQMKLQCRKCSTEFTVPQEMITEGPHMPVWQQAGKKNYTIKADIMKNFLHQFVNENVALTAAESESGDSAFNDSASETASSSTEEEDMEEEEEEDEEEEDEEEDDYEGYEDSSYTQNYYNYEAEF